MAEKLFRNIFNKGKKEVKSFKDTVSNFRDVVNKSPLKFNPLRPGFVEPKINLPQPKAQREIIPTGNIEKKARRSQTPVAEVLATTDFFKPIAGKTRVRDVVREVPDQFFNLATDIGQSISRNIILGARTAQGERRPTITPTTRIQEIITGVETGEDFDLEDEGRDIVSILGKEATSKVPPEALYIIGSISAFSDMFGGSSTKGAIKNIAKETSPDAIRAIIKQELPGLPDNIVEQIIPRLAKETTEKGVQRVLQKSAVAQQIQKEVAPQVSDDLIKEARKYKSADEFAEDSYKGLLGDTTEKTTLELNDSKKIDLTHSAQKIGGEVVHNVGGEMGGKRVDIRYITDNEKIIVTNFASELTGKRYGTDLLNKLIQDAKNSGYTKIIADDLKSKNASGYWSKLGFQISEDGYRAILDIKPTPKSQLEEIWKRANTETETEKIITPIIDQATVGTQPSTFDEVAPTQRTRGVVRSLKDTPNLPEDAKDYISNLPDDVTKYDVVTNKEAVQRAEKAIAENPEQVLLDVLDATKIDKDTATKAIALIDKYSREKNFAVVGQIVETVSKRATLAGQYNQAFSLLNKLTPQGWVSYARRKVGVELAPEFIEQVTKKAESIIEKPFGYQKIKETGELEQSIIFETRKNKGIKNKIYQDFLEIGNAMRTWGSSFMDFSMSLRQGLTALPRYPKPWAKAFLGQFKAFYDELPIREAKIKNRGQIPAYEEIMDQVVKHPDYQDAIEHGISLSDIDGVMNTREEAFMSSWAEKMPMIPKLKMDNPLAKATNAVISIGNVPLKIYNAVPAKLIRATNAAATAFRNKLAIEMYAQMKRNMKNITPDRLDQNLVGLASLTNDLTGRGNLPNFLQSSAPLLNAIFYSPRLIASRLNLMSPTSYIRRPKAARKEHLKTMLSTSAMITTILAAASLHPDVEVGTDPRSSDFAKIRVGNTRYDIAGGFQQYIRIGAQLISGKYVSSSTGRVITLGEGYNPITRWDILTRGAESKFSPLTSLIVTMFRGENFMGEKAEFSDEIGKRFVPMLISDLTELHKEDPELLPTGVLGMFGVGVQSYGPPEAIKKMQEIQESSNPALEMSKLKKQDAILYEKVKKAQVESTFTEFDWGLTYLSVQDGERAQFLADYFDGMPRNEMTKLRADLREKGLISDTVNKQLNALISNKATQSSGSLLQKAQQMGIKPSGN